MPDRADDAPILDPTHDLLAMNPDAERVARLVAGAGRPFTLGIYGSWGEGKTSFAHLVRHHLNNQDGWRDHRFVPFSAWPYVTADAVWRALLETIARKVYAVPVRHDPPPPLRSRLRRLLLKEVFPGSTAPPPDELRRQEFEQLMTKLGRSTALTSRGAADDETARQLARLAGVVLDVAGTAAGPLGSLRGLLGPAEPAGGAKTSVATVEEIREGIKELFAKASVPRTVVLIDDLDRCLPEVAFDVLETIKVLLSESAATAADCLFIVAVDLAVLSRGLNARLGDPGEPPMDARRYLEKVVQFGVSAARMRASTPRQLIAGRFPEWVGATDLLDLATTGNPRRLKQHCELLTFGYEPAGEQDR